MLGLPSLLLSRHFGRESTLAGHGHKAREDYVRERHPRLAIKPTLCHASAIQVYLGGVDRVDQLPYREASWVVALSRGKRGAPSAG